MKIFSGSIIASIFCLAWADVGNANQSVANLEDKASDSKLKRDASLLSGIYHGPSYKYLPPTSISSLYDSFAGNAASYYGLSGGYVSGIGSGHSSGGYPIRGHGHHYNNDAFNGFGYKAIPSHSSGHYNFGFTYPNHYHDHGHNHHHEPAFKINTGPNIAANFGHRGFSAGRIPSHDAGYGLDASGPGVPSHPHSLVGLSNGYEYSNGGVRNPFPSSVPTGLGSPHGLNNAFVSGLDEEHHDGHVHNGGQGHFYVISKEPSDFDNVQEGGRLIPTASYIPPVKQYPLPSNSYGDRIGTVGGSYNNNYHSQANTATRREPTYAAGHKGLGYFSFTANKPKVLHTSLVASSFEKPSYSKVPFKPSTFLGAKFENPTQSDILNQHNFPNLSKDVETTGYDYTIPSNPSVGYQEPSYQQSAVVDKNSIHEPGSTYVKPKHNEGSPNELSSDSTEKYFLASNSYSPPYSH